MDPHFLHIRTGFDDAAVVLGKWVGRILDPDDLCIEPEENGWNTLSLDLDYGETVEWLKLAQSFDVFYESYSTSLRMGELVFCRDGQLVRHLLIDAENPDQNVDLGRLPSEEAAPLRSWGDIWGYVDDQKWIKDM
jgi:hypothetical protein